MNKGKNILICPLEWGLGHAGRMIPLARRLQELNNTVYIGAGHDYLNFFRAEKCNFEYLEFSGFRPVYSRNFPQYFSLLLQLPLLLYHIFLEHFRIKSLIKRYRIDILISDNRFGLWNKKIRTVYVTHQLIIPFPVKFRFLENIGSAFHGYFIRKYDLCFIPDLPGEINLSGRLSHPLKLPANARYIGILSRFSNLASRSGTKFNFKYCTLILSGPEPQRSILRGKILSSFINYPGRLVILEGNPGSANEHSLSDRIMSFGHLAGDDMKTVICGSESIVTRAGYTTIMELASLKCSALLVPTPGQTEQEYLADYLSGKGWFQGIKQSDLIRQPDLPSDKGFQPAGIQEDSNILLDKALDELLNQ